MKKLRTFAVSMIIAAIGLLIYCAGFYIKSYEQNLAARQEYAELSQMAGVKNREGAGLLADGKKTDEDSSTKNSEKKRRKKQSMTMANENNFKETVNSLFKGMDSFISAKTVVGEAIHVGDTIILPLMDVSFGVGAGAFSGEKKDNGGGGMAGKMTPCAVLVIQNGTTKLVNVKNQDGLTKILDMVPDFVDRFTSGKGDEESVGESEK